MAAPFPILITGPESSGKTTLAKKLSEILHGTFINECARDYLNELDQPYNLTDLNRIIDLQFQQEYEAKLRSKSNYLLFDTGPIVLSVWLKVRFNETSKRLKEWISNSNYDLILLCKPDIPWEEDPLREHPEHRMELYELYKKILKENQLDYQEVSGNKDQRLRFSLSKIENLKKV
ncbi:MAG: AAA family ATPase [Salibacteraceae bacterium]